MAPRSLSLLGLLFPLLFAGCGRPPLAKTKPLWPALYEIDAKDVPAPGDFIRYAEPGPKGGGLDVAVTDYVSDEPGKPRVRLVGAVHVADAIYYQHVQKVLDEADLVLYEAVKPEGVGMEAWKASVRPKDPKQFVGFQQELAAWFGFTYQLDGIDYSSDRFVHADMTVEQFRKEGGGALLDQFKIGSAGEGTLDDRVKGVLDWIRSLGRLLLSEPGPIRSLARRSMAEALGNLDEVDALSMFPGLGDLILHKRDAVVIETLQKHLADTSGTIAIFYGVAHDPDLARRLAALGYHRDSGFWLRAWALRPPL